MNSPSQDQNPGPSISSLSPAPFDPAAIASAVSGNDIPPELKLGEVALVIDQGGLIVAAEPICAALFQWEPEELVGQALEVLLVAGTENLREQLVARPSAPGEESQARARVFALAQRKDGTSFPVAVTLELISHHAAWWWTVAFQDVSSAPVAQPVAPTFHPRRVSRRRRAQIAAPLALESIPDIFQRAPAEPTPGPASSALGAPGEVRAGPAEARQEQQPPSAPPAGSSSQQSEPPPAAAPLSPQAAQPTEAARSDSEGCIRELKQRLGQSAADLKRTQAHLRQQDEQLYVANTAAHQAATALEEQRARCSQLEEQLGLALQTGDELNNQLAAERQARVEAESRLQELEQRLAQSTEELERARAQSQAPAASPPAPNTYDPALPGQLLEHEARLRTAVTSLARATAELETERGERRRSEQRAATQAARMQQLHEELKLHLETEQIDQQRFTELEHQLHEQTQQNDLTVAKLQSALQLEQCERKRLEAELQRSRFGSADSARSGRSLVNGLRRQLHPPAESLHHSACRLLQGQLSDEQKHVVQGMLESTLLLQTALQETPEG